ncbi:MAG TPA: 6-carboxytetrahydropterin synthase [Bacteroidales bacterium]|nr:6-carboxytetrahydropterin synthase [Bacteroidales bacterium]HSA42952.1 6-carboxytetrahydropterin synthase [Bacteroidales bacterium]
MVYLTRRERFNAAHRLFRPDFTDEQNLEVFGKCSNPNWHGHNYILYVTVRGNVDPQTGFVVNLSTLSRVIRERVVDKLDHRNINLEVPFMQGRLASTENLASAIFDELREAVAALGAELYAVRIEETENNMVEFRLEK